MAMEDILLLGLRITGTRGNRFFSKSALQNFIICVDNCYHLYIPIYCHSTFYVFLLQISDWFQNSGNIYLSRTELGDNVESAQSISTEHDVFEQDSMRIQGDLLKLVRTADQLSHTANVDVTSLRHRLRAVDELAQDFMIRMDARRRNIATAINFYRLSAQVILMLKQFTCSMYY